MDQFNHSGEEEFAYLKSMDIDGFPSELSEIDFTAGGGNENSGHRAYTHCGWNYHYRSDRLNKGHADVRKQLLLAVTDHVFRFDAFYEDHEADKVCKAMSCLLYNTHILGDRYHSKTYYGAANTLPLAYDSRTESVISDLIGCFEVLFGDQIHESGYRNMVIELMNCSSDIIREHRMAGADNDRHVEIDREYAKEIRDILSCYLPGLLYTRPWFTAVFPEKWRS